ncbi:MAG: inorganic diphosphatase [Terriglobales bacterium]
MNYLSLPIGDKAPALVNAVIEIPARGVNKYEYDKELHVFRLDRTLYSPVHYPGDYGFIPHTRAADGDPLDILVLVDEPTFTGCLVEVRPVGMLEMLDQGVKDEKVLAVNSNNPRYQDVCNYNDVEPHVLREIAHFFEIYKDLEGKRTKMIAWHDIQVAHETIRRSYQRYLESTREGEQVA